MEQFIGCDAHKKFSVFVAVNEKGQAGEALRVNHERPLYREFLASALAALRRCVRHHRPHLGEDRASQGIKKAANRVVPADLNSFPPFGEIMAVVSLETSH